MLLVTMFSFAVRVPGPRAGLLAGLLILAARPLLAQHDVVVPAGTTLPIRFLQGLASGRDSVGTPVLAQSLAALAVDSCVVVPPYVNLVGEVTESREPGRRGRPGTLAMRFTRIMRGPLHHLVIDAVLDSLEYAVPRDVNDSGLVVAGRGARAGRMILVPLAATAAVAASDVLVLPVAIVSGFELLKRGPPVRIIAGEVGRVRLQAPVTVPGDCTPAAAHRSLTQIPVIPRFVPQTANRSGSRSGDPINVVLLGSGPELDMAFTAAGWQIAGRGSAEALAREVAAIITGGSTYEAPVSTEYFAGRPQDVTWQLPGLSARVRHHIRLWLLDSLRGVWVGSAIKDIGVLVRPFTGTATHRVDPDADAERDFTVTALEATGCAHLVDYVALPGALKSGHNIAHQRFFTDGRAAIVRLRQCPVAPE